MDEIRKKYFMFYIIILVGYLVGSILMHIFLYFDWVIGFVIVWSMSSISIILMIEKDVEDYREYKLRDKIA